MNPDIVKMVSSARKVMSESRRIALYMNGLLLTPKLASKMVEVGLTSVYVSLDSLNVERLKITRRGIDYAGVLRSLEFY